VRFVLGATALLALPHCAHADEPKEELPLYEDLLFAQIDKDKPKPKYEFPFDNLPIDDEVPSGASSGPVNLTRPVDAGWEASLSGCGSESVGKASRGKLRNGRQVPPEGTGFVRKNDKAVFGTDEAVAIVLWACARMVEMYSGSVPVVVGDISNEKGGRLRPHSSHQSGRDVDLGYYFKDNEGVSRFKDASSDNLDVEKSWSLMELLLSTDRVEYMFIDKSLQPLFHAEAERRGWSQEDLASLFEAPIGARARCGIIRHQKGHRHHFHVRFTCDLGDKECK